MLVSVAISFLNAEQTLLDAIRSVFAQTCTDWELILLDDGSTDQSLEIARSVRDERVRVVSDGRNLGIPARLNQTAAFARGKYLARMDSDDMMHPERLERQVEYLEANRQLDLIGSAIYTIDGDNNLTGIRHDDPVDTRPASVLRSGFINQPTGIALTDWWRRNQYDESFPKAEDHEFFCRAACTSRLARMPQPLLYYREKHKSPWGYVKEYRRHVRYFSKCHLEYGPRILGWPATARILLESWGKLAIYHAATACGSQKLIISRRHGRQLTPEETSRAEAGLSVVGSTPVPGVSASVEVSSV